MFEINLKKLVAAATAVTALSAGAAAAQEACTNYTVQDGDTMATIAIAAYGSMNWFAVGSKGQDAAAPLVALILTSTLLHYYFDGFIWKVREERTQAGFDLEAGERSGGLLSTDVKSALAWAAGIADPAATPRLDLAKAVLAQGDQALVRALGARNRLQAYSFASGLEPLPWLPVPEDPEAPTDLGRGVWFVRVLNGADDDLTFAESGCER